MADDVDSQAKASGQLGKRFFRGLTDRELFEWRPPVPRDFFAALCSKRTKAITSSRTCDGGRIASGGVARHALSRGALACL